VENDFLIVRVNIWFQNYLVNCYVITQQ
jgi:hypothetical protein